jgi:hypothetical protein
VSVITIERVDDDCFATMMLVRQDMILARQRSSFQDTLIRVRSEAIIPFLSCDTFIAVALMLPLVIRHEVD